MSNEIDTTTCPKAVELEHLHSWDEIGIAFKALELEHRHSWDKIGIALFSLEYGGGYSWNMMEVINGTSMEYVGILRNRMEQHGI